MPASFSLTALRVEFLRIHVCGHLIGVVISLVSAKDGSGYAVVLDGTTFREVARAKFPYGLPCGLHGCWIPRT